jgi:hypothetical protein
VKQLIKDAIMENDFLKNLDGGQVREIVDSMYPRDFEKGSFVIREGDAGKSRDLFDQWGTGNSNFGAMKRAQREF